MKATFKNSYLNNCFAELILFLLFILESFCPFYQSKLFERIFINPNPATEQERRFNSVGSKMTFGGQLEI